MATRILNVVLRLALLAAMVACVVLFIDYRAAADPKFCGEASSCAAVRSGGVELLGQLTNWLPAIGLGAFIGLFAMAIWAAHKQHYKILAIQTGLVAAGAVGFIALQALYIKAICPFCMVVDVAAIVAFGVAFALWRQGQDNDEKAPLRYLWAAAGLAAVSVPFFWDYSAAANPVDVPKVIAKHHQADKVNVVMFTDFECPFCRRAHKALEGHKSKLGARLNMVRLMYPLSFHKGAEPSALAYLCTPNNLRDQMAERLYEVDPSQLTIKGVLAIGAETGIGQASLSKCLADPRTLDRLKHEKLSYTRAGLDGGVPATFINDELVKGADEIALGSAIDRATGGSGGGTDIVWMFVFIALVGGGVATASLVGIS